MAASRAEDGDDSPADPNKRTRKAPKVCTSHPALTAPRHPATSRGLLRRHAFQPSHRFSALASLHTASLLTASLHTASPPWLPFTPGFPSQVFEAVPSSTARKRSSPDVKPKPKPKDGAKGKASQPGERDPNAPRPPQTAFMYFSKVGRPA